MSNGRVFCDFCKCWYADNKVEKETHERGSKHQMAKAKALAGIRKLSEWNAKEQDKIEGYLAEADRAAKVSYLKISKKSEKLKKLISRKHTNAIYARQASPPSRQSDRSVTRSDWRRNDLMIWKSVASARLDILG